MAVPCSIVIPTFQRALMLRRVLPSYLAAGAAEVVIVDDGSGDPDAGLLRELSRARSVRLIRGPHAGLPAARNAGAAAATGEWIVFGEDDVWFRHDYAARLVEHARAAGALVASGVRPLVDPSLLDGDAGTLEDVIGAKPMMEPRPDELLELRIPVERLPSGDMVTPMLMACAAVHRSVFDRVRYDVRYVGNAFREETDFFLSCWEAGIRTLHCPHAACGHMKRTTRALPGGAWSTGPLRFAYGMWRNNWRLLTKHRGFVEDLQRANGRSPGLVRAQASFLRTMLGRIRPESA